MAEECCATDGQVMILACSGGSNVGQLANQAAVELTREGLGKIYCLGGIGGHLSGFVQSAKDAPRMVVIDGCDIGCAKAILNHAEIPLKNYVVVTELGIGKNHEFNLNQADIERVKEAVRETVANGTASSRKGRQAIQCCSCSG